MRNDNCEIDVTITIQTTSVQLEQNQNFTVYVTIHGGVRPTQSTWTKQGTQRLPPNVLQQGNNLVIINANRQMTGSYVFTVYTVYGVVTKTIYIKVTDGQPPIITIPKEEIHTLEGTIGDGFSFECRAEGNPMPSIHINTPRGIQRTDIVAQQIGSFPTRLQSNTARFEIGRFTDDNTGEYTCIASNAYGTVSKIIRVKSRQQGIPPHVGINPKIVEGIEGGFLSIQAQFIGTEPVGVAVTLNGNAVSFNIDKENKLIIFPRITKSMAGTYTVTVSNSFGKHSDYFTLNVKSKDVIIVTAAPLPLPTDPVVINPNKVLSSDLMITRYLRNKDIVIDPQVNTDISTKFEWSKDGDELPQFAKPNGQLLAIQLRTGYDGTYTLRYRDSHGLHEKRFRVLSNPKQSIVRLTGTSDIYLITGESVLISCDLSKELSSTPQSTTWYRLDENKRPRANPHKNVFFREHNLRIVTANMNNSDEYRCISIDKRTRNATIEAKIHVTESDYLSAKLSDRRRQVRLGDSLELGCEVTSKPGASITWYHNGRQIIDNDHFTAQSDRLEIRATRASMAGYYECRVEHSNETAYDTALITLENAFRPTRPQPTSTQTAFSATINADQQEFSIGDRVELNCQVRNKPIDDFRFYWTKDGGDLPLLTFDNERGTLEIQRASEEHSGTYECHVEDRKTGATRILSTQLSLRSDSPNTDITVAETEVNIEIEPKNAEAKSGENVRLTCHLQNANSDSYRFTWHFSTGETELPTNARDSRNGVLDLVNVEPSQSGYYRCTARNQRTNTEMSASTQLTINASAAPLGAILSPSYHIANEGESARFQCQVPGDSQTEYEYQWRREGGQLPDGADTSTEGVLYFREVSQQDAGVFVCTVYNRESRTSVQSNEAQLAIKAAEQEVPLVVRIEPGSNTFTQGHVGTLYCIVEGGLAPNVKWFRHHGEFTERHVAKERTLRIENVQPEDRGYYGCNATDERGESNVGYTSVDVEPRIKPKLTMHPRSGSHEVGDSVAMDCRVDEGIPTPTIEWRRADGRGFSARAQFLYENVRLMITDLRPEDAGRYLCIAKNEAGVAEVAFDLQVSKSESGESDEGARFEPQVTDVVEEESETEPIATTTNFAMENSQPPANIIESHADTIKIRLDYQGTQLKFGYRLKMQCASSDQNVNKVEWKRVDGQPIGGEMTLSNNGRSNTMEFLVRSFEMGIYECVSTRWDGAVSRKYLSLVNIGNEVRHFGGGDMNGHEEFVKNAGERRLKRRDLLRLRCAPGEKKCFSLLR